MASMVSSPMAQAWSALQICGPWWRWLVPKCHISWPRHAETLSTKADGQIEVDLFAYKSMNMCIYIYVHLYYTYIHTYIALHCIALHCMTLHYMTWHYITWHDMTLHYITFHYIHTVQHTHLVPPSIRHDMFSWSFSRVWLVWSSVWRIPLIAGKQVPFFLPSTQSIALEHLICSSSVTCTYM